MAKFSVGKDILDTLKTWVGMLRNLSFQDNFRGYEWEGTIATGVEKKIQHDLKVIPTRFLVTDCAGIVTIVKGPTRATINFIYFTNTSTTTTFDGKILIMP